MPSGMPRVHLCCCSSVSILTIHYPYVGPGVGYGAGRRVAWSTVWVVGCHRYVSKVPSSCSNIISLFRRTTCLYLLSTVQPIALTFSWEGGQHRTLCGECRRLLWTSALPHSSLSSFERLDLCFPWSWLRPGGRSGATTQTCLTASTVSLWWGPYTIV